MQIRQSLTSSVASKVLGLMFTTQMGSIRVLGRLSHSLNPKRPNPKLRTHSSSQNDLPGIRLGRHRGFSAYTSTGLIRLGAEGGRKPPTRPI